MLSIYDLLELLQQVFRDRDAVLLGVLAGFKPTRPGKARTVLAVNLCDELFEA